jgi:tRNA G46 methylase TrmB
MLKSANYARLEWDLGQRDFAPYDEYWHKKDYRLLPPSLFEDQSRDIWLEIGAGTGWFFTELAEHNPEKFLVAIERCRMRGKRLVRKTTRSGLQNLMGVRGNAIPALICGIPTGRLERIYILYPCPWLKTRDRKHRWYLHPIMPHLVRLLKPGGRLIWASDQKFYIDEAAFVCREKYGLHTLSYGEIRANPYNDLDKFPCGRSKFEHTFLANGQPCYEVIVTKNA